MVNCNKKFEDYNEEKIIYKASFKCGENRYKRIIKSPIKLGFNSQLTNLLKGDFFKGTESTGEIEYITLKRIDEETYSFLRKNKKIVGLLLSDEKGYLEVEKREVL